MRKLNCLWVRSPLRGDLLLLKWGPQSPPWNFRIINNYFPMLILFSCFLHVICTQNCKIKLYWYTGYTFILLTLKDCLSKQTWSIFERLATRFSRKGEGNISVWWLYYAYFLSFRFPRLRIISLNSNDTDRTVLDRHPKWTEDTFGIRHFIVLSR